MKNIHEVSFQSWKEKLENLEQMPGWELDKRAAWEKLQLRMQKNKPVKKTNKWYYAAAAACLIVSGLLFWKMESKEKAIYVHSTPAPKSDSPVTIPKVLSTEKFVVEAITKTGDNKQALPVTVGKDVKQKIVIATTHFHRREVGVKDSTGEVTIEKKLQKVNKIQVQEPIYDFAGNGDKLKIPMRVNSEYLKTEVQAAIKSAGHQ